MVVPAKVFIDIMDVPELRDHQVYREHISLGANVTLAEMIVLFSGLADQNPLMFGYLRDLAEHIGLVANTPVRNVSQ